MQPSHDESTHHNGPQKTHLDIARGTGYAAVLGLIGFIATTILLYILGCWVPKQIFIPAIGTGFVLAGTGWATFAPRGHYRFARTLAIIFFISIPSWYVLGAFMPDSNEKFSEQPLYLSELLFLGVPPITTGLILAMMRRKGPRFTADQKEDQRLGSDEEG